MKRLTYSTLAVITACTALPAHAALRDAKDIKAGGFSLTPTLNASVGYDDNITTAPSNERSANVYKLAPSLAAKTKFGDFVDLRLNTSGEKGVYAGQAFNNYYDYSFGGDLGFKISNKQNLVFSYGYVRGHDPAGGSSAVVLNAIEEHRTNNGSLAYTLGEKNSVARLELGVRGEGKRYLETGSQGKDKDQQTVDVALFTNVAPKTDVFVQYIAAEHDFINVDDLDNDDNQIFLGVDWAATAKTSGRVKVGKQEKDYTKLAGSTKQDETVWDASVKWEPRSYSEFTLGLSRNADTGSGASNGNLNEVAVEKTKTSLDWGHKWSQDVKTTLGVSKTDEEYQGGSRNGIKADVLGFNAGLEFMVERNFTLTMDYGYEDKEASGPNAATAAAQGYKKSSAVLFGVEIGL